MIKTLPILLLKFILILSLVNSYNLNAQCTGISAAVEDITITSVSSSSIFYNYTIRNTGTSTISTNNLLIQNYVTNDQSTTGAQAAGGSFILGSINIGPNETHTGSFESNNFPNYSYLLLNLKYFQSGGCQASLDEEYELIPPVSGLFSSSASEKNSIMWNTETKSFTIQDWDKSTEGSLQYQLFNVAGKLIVSGNAIRGESTYINTQDGVYMLFVSDGKKSSSKKIIY
jgi:hypothetical protein